jgi:hypothetical protein
MRLLTWLRNLAPRPVRTRRPASRTLTLEVLEGRAVPSATQDFLYVGDAINNTVQRFDAATGASLGTFVMGNKSLDGPRGMIFDGAGHLLVANQNVNRGKPGEILRYDAATGAFLGELVPFQDPHAPFAPRGIVLKDNVLYVASLQDAGTTKAGFAPDGEVDRYDATTGQFLGALSRPAGWVGRFNPRGAAFGPDGNLYVGVFDSSNLNAGYVVKYDVSTNAATIFAFNNGDAVADRGETADLHRPEGLTFGPDGNLYVTGYRADANDTDKIVILNTSGKEVDNIPLDAVGQPRSYGQAILFGPGGRLFVPITTAGSPDEGAVREYDVDPRSATFKTFTNFEAPGTLGQGWYLTFGNTDPATLAYNTNPGVQTSAVTLAGAQTASVAVDEVVAALVAAKKSHDQYDEDGL